MRRKRKWRGERGGNELKVVATLDMQPGGEEEEDSIKTFIKDFFNYQNS